MKPTDASVTIGSRGGISLLAALLLLGTWSQAPAAQKDREGKKAPPKFVGVKKCANCHTAKEKGNQYAAWQKLKHAKAYQQLASKKAKALAKKKGIKDPQKSTQCLKCHVTAFGQPKARLAKAFNKELGVQCESCHGPGERHVRARFAAVAEEDEGDDDFGFGEEEEEEPEYKPLPKGEIIVNPSVATCLRCHNKQSPSFQGFCYKERVSTLRHPDPRKKRTKGGQTALECKCNNCACTAAECDARLNEIKK